LEETWRDADRDREVPVRVYLPASSAPAPLVVFSHGLGGSRANNAYLGEHLAKRGYVALFLQHPGSDESVWKDVGIGARMAKMREAASGKNLKLRVEDVKFALDYLLDGRCKALAGRLDGKNIGMSGHSFGALTTQALGGQWLAAAGTRFGDPRVTACVMYSPSPSKLGGTTAKQFGGVSIPWMLMTGTHDAGEIAAIKPSDRLQVFPALPDGDKYEVVLYEAEHSAFSDRALPGDSKPRNPNHHRAILALTTAFWDTYLRKDREAADWLKGDGPSAILEPKDAWKAK
jgi:predicted dienelactone hydrolase